MDISPVGSSSNLAQEEVEKPKVGSKRRKLRRTIRRLYSNIVQDTNKEDSRSSDDNSPPSSSNGQLRRRRHSASGPLNFARAAKESVFLRRLALVFWVQGLEF